MQLTISGCSKDLCIVGTAIGSGHSGYLMTTPDLVAMALLVPGLNKGISNVVFNSLVQAKNTGPSMPENGQLVNKHIPPPIYFEKQDIEKSFMARE